MYDEINGKQVQGKERKKIKNQTIEKMELSKSGIVI